MKAFGNLFKKKTHISNISESENLSRNINKNIEKIKNELGNSSDLSINLCKDNINENLCYVSIYIENIVDKDTINSLSSEITNVLKAKDKLKDCTPEGYFNLFKNALFGFRKSEEGTDFNVLISNLLSGKTLFFIDGYNKFFSIDTFSVEGRAVSEPTSQNVIRGPKECFVENINVNVSLLRNRIKNKSLRVEELSKGNITKTKIVIMYFDKIAKKAIVDELRRRLNSINIDGIFDSSYIEELIKDDRYSIFPQFLSSEKPDSVAAAILEGRVAILVNGTAYVLTAPALFTDFLQSSEDYYYPYLVASAIRIIRYIAFFLTLIVPAGYIALATFHQEMIPTQLLISIAAQREGVPFPAFVEALFMEGTFEILREAGVRMPKVIGPAISIVGALVLGQAAVDAGIISAVIVIIVSITAISSFAIPNYTMSNCIRLMRLALMILSAIFGLYGVFMGLIVLILHLCKLKSVGVPYMAPIATATKNGFKDTILRYPIWDNKYRPIGISNDKSPRVEENNPVTTEQKEEPEFR
ncbi:spore germination protein [Ruminiclostridium papyrosolvens]|uniref:Spore germination protein KA n=1 Tax=Ruminiclostridium papyrosolvens C7 TaxID=1330534 RepID=U4QWL0_9FIRM|nr:spore germination protein [Ruminiclostridium papyrosolvens]EPR07638.1 spore germination protein KA [Ruminiclostridium papyrosolvens C7]